MDGIDAYNGQSERENKKHPSRRVHFLLQKNTGNDERQIMTSKEVVGLALFSCHQPKAEDDDPEPTQKAKGRFHFLEYYNEKIIKLKILYIVRNYIV